MSNKTNSPPARLYLPCPRGRSGALKDELLESSQQPCVPGPITVPILQTGN